MTKCSHSIWWETSDGRTKLDWTKGSQMCPHIHKLLSYGNHSGPHNFKVLEKWLFTQCQIWSAMVFCIIWGWGTWRVFAAYYTFFSEQYGLLDKQMHLKDLKRDRFIWKILLSHFCAIVNMWLWLWLRPE